MGYSWKINSQFMVIICKKYTNYHEFNMNYP